MNRFKILIIMYLSITMLGFVSYLEAKEKTVFPDRTHIIGEWLRSDGDYVINIKKFNKNGSLDVTYHNPKLVNVSRSMFMQKNSELKVFIELIDKGYPRSTYTLNYDQKNHALLGDYFHAGMNKTFKVMFLRKNK